MTDKKQFSDWPDFINNFSDYVSDPKWKQLLDEKKELIDILLTFIEKDYNKYRGYFQILPSKNLVMNALSQTPFDNVKVVIVGQDPYQTLQFPIGLSFAVRKRIAIPKSLINIYRECATDSEIQFETPSHGDLTSWAQQGVLLLNNTLTVLEGTSNSHVCFKDENDKRYFWKDFTDHIIKKLSKDGNGIVFMLWGKNAQEKEKIIDKYKHLVLKAAHPSPLSANKGGWFGCKHFSKANAYLLANKRTPINWNSLKYN
jgi:uracil-DNA glycosylase